MATAEVLCPRCGASSGEDARFCAACGAPLQSAPDREARKLVTILFCDLVESTKLAERFDPEALQRLLARYFSAARSIVERHGGTLEKFIGDAVFAVFGMPTLREDDALRAVRAAVELRDAVVRLDDELGSPGLAARVGVNSGEVFVALDDLAVAGDAVWTAKRLEEAAPRGGVLLGPTTHALVRGEVDAEELPSVALKGRRERVTAYLVRELRPGVPGRGRRLDSPLVGRTRELDELRAALVEAEALSEPRLVTLLGPAGIGKTRLVRELAAAAPHARMLSGRCLPYGDGITYWPLVEILRDVAGLGGRESASEARARLADLVAGADDAERIVDDVGAALGLGGEASSAEVFLAARRLLEHLAAEAPLVVVFEDLQWAEPVFLDLVEYVAAESRGFPLVLCCVSRPELLEARPDWTGSRTIVLEALPPDEVQLLISNLLGTELTALASERVAAGAGGNPLFVEELLWMLIEERVLLQQDGGWRVAADPSSVPLPPSITALLSARLERLPEDERSVLERAAVVGEVFSARGVEALADLDRAFLGGVLERLERKQLVRRRPSARRGEDEWRFGHILVRDAAYAALPKLTRAELHERAARWIESRFAGGIEVDDISGYHLAQAAEARADLDALDERAGSLAAEAAARLASAARRAVARGDSHAAASLLGRTVALLPPDDSDRPELLVDLAQVLARTGRLDEAEARVREAATRAEVAGLEPVVRRAALELADLHWYTNPQEGTEALLQAAHAGIPVFERERDSTRLVEAWWAVAEVHLFRCEFVRMQAALEQALEAAPGAGREQRARVRNALAHAAMLGPTPVEDALRLCRELQGETEGHRSLEALLQLYEAYLEALGGHFGEARERAAAARPVLAELGRRILLGSQRRFAGQIELLAGDPAAAEAQLRDGFRTLRELGERGNAASLAADLAVALHALGRDEEAGNVAAEAVELGNPDDAEVQVLCRLVRAGARAAAGAVQEAVAVAREAVEIAERTDASTLRGDALLALAGSLRAAGDEAEAREAGGRALGLYESKGNRVGAAAARSFLGSREVSLR